jgi:hypothetical protein
MTKWSRCRINYRLIRDGGCDNITLKYQLTAGYDKIPVKYQLTGAIDFMRPSGWKISMWHKIRKT